MSKPSLDHGVLKNKASGELLAALIKYTTVSGIGCIYCGQSEYYDKQKWEVVYRGPKEGYTGPEPEHLYIWDTYEKGGE